MPDPCANKGYRRVTSQTAQIFTQKKEISKNKKEERKEKEKKKATKKNVVPHKTG